MNLTVAKTAGFCFGVKRAVDRVYEQIETADKQVYTFGPIIHNEMVVEDLAKHGVKVIDSEEELRRLEDGVVVIRSHGVGKRIYDILNERNVTIVDATCPVVLQLQRKIHKCYMATRGSHTQVVIYGKKGHAEVNGLVGQTEGTAIVVEKVEDLDRLDFDRNICLFSQTTKSLDGFREVVAEIRRRIAEGVQFEYFDTICRQVANRLPNIKTFASKHDWVYFVAGKKSSNGKMLLEECRKANPNTVFISEAKEISEPLPEGVNSVGVCGATSTPKWLMEEVAVRIRELNTSR